VLFVALLIASSLAAENRSFTLTAHQFEFDVTPLPFEVNLGDVVTLTINASDDGDGGSGHGFSMQEYADTTQHELHPGSPVTIQFTASTPGEFIYFCTRVCGLGHNGMHGVFRVIGEIGPTVTDVTPSLVPTSGGTLLTIDGTGFVAGATVTMDGRDAADVEVVSETRIRARAPRGPFTFSSPLPAMLRVTNPDSTTAQRQFTWVVPPPAIQTIAPISGSSAGGTLVTITGAGFSTAVSLDVKFGGTSATNVTVIDAVTLTAVTPAHALGAVAVGITTNKGSTSSPAAFTFRATPRRRAVRK
jgi:plastocyanin